MSVSQRELLLMLVYSPIVGALIGIVYDFFRILRIAAATTEKNRGSTVAKGRKTVATDRKNEAAVAGRKSRGGTRQAVVIVQDVVFAVTCGIIAVLYMYCLNDGKIRFFVLAGMTTGFALYYITIGRAVIYFSEKIIAAVFAATAFILRITVIPVAGVLKKLYKTVRNALLYKIRKKRTAVHFRQMMKSARNGFRD